MNEKQSPNLNSDSQTPASDNNDDQSPFDIYGWEFHKKPMLYALIVTILFYAFIFWFVRI